MPIYNYVATARSPSAKGFTRNANGHPNFRILHHRGISEKKLIRAQGKGSAPLYHARNHQTTLAITYRKNEEFRTKILESLLCD